MTGGWYFNKMYYVLHYGDFEGEGGGTLSSFTVHESGGVVGCMYTADNPAGAEPECESSWTSSAVSLR